MPLQTINKVDAGLQSIPAAYAGIGIAPPVRYWARSYL